MELERCRICKRKLKSETIKVIPLSVRGLIHASAIRKDGLFTDRDAATNLTLHVKCRAIYTRYSRLVGHAAFAEKKKTKLSAVPSSPQERIVNGAVLRKTEVVNPWTPPDPHQVFDFQKHCFFCTRDASDDFIRQEQKRPLKRRVFVRNVGQTVTKETVLKWSFVYKDTWSQQVRERIESVNLISVKARYHSSCYRAFVWKRNTTDGVQNKVKGRPRKTGEDLELERAVAKEDSDSDSIMRPTVTGGVQKKLRGRPRKTADDVELAIADDVDDADADAKDDSDPDFKCGVDAVRKSSALPQNKVKRRPRKTADDVELATADDVEVATANDVELATADAKDDSDSDFNW